MAQPSGSQWGPVVRPERVAQEHDGAEAEAGHAEEGFETDQGHDEGGQAQDHAEAGGEVVAGEGSGAVMQDHGDSEAGDQGEGAGQAAAQAGAAGEEAAEGDGWDHAADDHRQGGGGESGAAGVVVGKGPQVGDGDSSMLLGGERGGHGVRAVGATKPPPFES
ncbi:hypothetical protein [Streptomyces sp. SAI-195]|uniref:hypothetical protein n=1 Tax=Streptomyces sp. SAI-195 TaxID=3377734 RepID=UPI003C7B02DF